MAQYVETYNRLRERIEHGPLAELPAEEDVTNLRALRWMPDTDAEIEVLLQIRLARLQQAMTA